MHGNVTNGSIARLVSMGIVDELEVIDIQHQHRRGPWLMSVSPGYLLRTIEVSRIDPKWATPVTSTTGYAVAAMFYLIFCYGMSRYARAMEARLAKSDRR